MASTHSLVRFGPPARHVLFLLTLLGSTLGLSARPAQAQVPVAARLNTFSATSPLNAAILDVGVRLPDGSVTNYSSLGTNAVHGVQVQLEVRFSDSANYVDVTGQPTTTIYSVPDHPLDRFFRLPLSVADAGTTVTIYGRYTSPNDPSKSVTTSRRITLRLLDAPRHYSGGRAQTQLIPKLNQLNAATQAWLHQTKVSSANATAVQRTLNTMQYYLQNWWIWKMAPALNDLGSTLSAAGAPASVMRLVSQFANDLAAAGLVRLGQDLFGYSLQPVPPVVPPWVPAAPVLSLLAGPVYIFWYGL